MEMVIPWQLFRTIGPLTLHSQDINTCICPSPLPINCFQWDSKLNSDIVLCVVELQNIEIKNLLQIYHDHLSYQNLTVTYHGL